MIAMLPWDLRAGSPGRDVDRGGNLRLRELSYGEAFDLRANLHQALLKILRLTRIGLGEAAAEVALAQVEEELFARCLVDSLDRGDRIELRELRDNVVRARLFQDDGAQATVE